MCHTFHLPLSLNTKIITTNASAIFWKWKQSCWKLSWEHKTLLEISRSQREKNAVKRSCIATTIASRFIYFMVNVIFPLSLITFVSVYSSFVPGGIILKIGKRVQKWHSRNYFPRWSWYDGYKSNGLHTPGVHISFILPMNFKPNHTSYERLK